MRAFTVYFSKPHDRIEGFEIFGHFDLDRPGDFSRVVDFLLEADIWYTKIVFATRESLEYGMRDFVNVAMLYPAEQHALNMLNRAAGETGSEVEFETSMLYTKGYHFQDDRPVVSFSSLETSSF